MAFQQKIVLWRRAADALFHFLYAPTCLHCKLDLEKLSQLFCDSCASLLTLQEPEKRCAYCFTDENLLYPALCRNCAGHESSLYRAASALDYLGPAVSLVKHLKQGNQTYLARGAAGFLVAQFVRLGWPFPDIITFVPQPLLKQMMRGFNQSELLAREAGKMLNSPVQDLLLRRSGDFSQVVLNQEQRLQLKNDNIFLRKKRPIEGKIILLIDDLMSTGATLQSCGEALQEGLPSRVYALALCKEVIFNQIS